LLRRSYAKLGETGVVDFVLYASAVYRDEASRGAVNAVLTVTDE